MTTREHLINAVQDGNTIEVKRLLEHGADVNARNDGGETSIHRACGGWNIEDTLFQVLLDAGAEMDVRDNYDDTPLHHACGHGRPHAVRFLLDAGADPNAKDKGGRIPLDLTERVAEAREEVKREIIDLFREHAPEQVMEAYCTNEQTT
jgi:ankyrin repeat protein